MKICFLARPSFDRYSVAIYKHMNKKIDNFHACFVTMNKSESDYIINEISNAEVYEVSKHLKEHWNEFEIQDLSMYENKYNCSPVWHYILTDRFLRGKDYEYVVKLTVGLFHFFENIYESGVNLYYSETVATLLCYISYIVGKKYQAKYLVQTQVRGSLDSEYHYISSDPYLYDIHFNPNYMIEKFSESEIKFAEEYLKEFEENYSIPPGQVALRKIPKIRINFLLLPLKRLIKSFNKELNDPFSYMYFESYKDSTNEIKYYINYKKAKKYYQKADYTKKYVYFPLHYQPEASTLVCASKYENQMVFIDALAKSLPGDTLFYIKEHYAVLGNRDPHFYEEVRKYPNVVIIDPWENSKKLIEEAQAVVTLTGTAGYEAMLLRKPVIVGGNVFYESAPGVIKVNDIYGKYIEIMDNYKKPEREDIIKYLCATFRGYRKGNVYAQNYYEMIEDSINDICESLYKQLVEWKMVEEIRS